MAWKLFRIFRLDTRHSKAQKGEVVMVNARVLISIAMIGVLGLAGCAAPKKEAQKTSLEIQAIQSKDFETPKKIAFNSVMSVLQDLGYIIGSASLETGFISAKSPSKQDDSGQAAFAAAFAGIRTELTTAVTASVEEIRPNYTKIRLNFVTQKRRSSAYGQNASDDEPILDPKIYQNAFDRIGEAVFIRSSSK